MSGILSAAGDRLESGKDTSALEFKMLYEKEIKSRVSSVLDKLVGEKKYIAEAAVEISPVTEKMTRQTSTTDPGEKIDPTIWQLFGENTSKVEQQVTESKHRLTSVSITVILEDGVPAETETEVKDSLLRIFKGLKENSLYIKKAKFAPEGGSGFAGFFETNKVFILGLVLLAAVLGFLFGPVRSFMKGASKGQGNPKIIDIKMAGEQLEGRRGGGLPEGQQPEEQKTESRTRFEDKETKKADKPFAFISKDNLKDLATIIQGEPPELISLVLSYLEEEYAATVVGYFKPELKAKVALSMMKVRQSDKASVNRAEVNIKEKLNFLVGGLDKFSGILEKMDKETRESVLTAVYRESPEMADRVKNSLFTFESIQGLPDAALQMALKEIKPDTLAKALTGAGETLKEKFLKNLSEGGRARLKEEFELAGYMTPVSVEKERSRIVRLFRLLEAEGKIGIESIRKASALQQAAPLREGEEKVELSDYEEKDSAKTMSLRKMYKAVNGAGGKKEKESPVGPEKK